MDFGGWDASAALIALLTFTLNYGMEAFEPYFALSLGNGVENVVPVQRPHDETELERRQLDLLAELALLQLLAVDHFGKLYIFVSFECVFGLLGRAERRLLESDQLQLEVDSDMRRIVIVLENNTLDLGFLVKQAVCDEELLAQGGRNVAARPITNVIGADRLGSNDLCLLVD